MRNRLHRLMRGELPKSLTCYTGAEPAYLPLLLSAGSAAVSYMGQQDAADRKERLAKAMGAYKLGNANKQADVVNAYIAKDTPQARQQQNDAATAEAKSNYDTSVGAAQAFTNPGQVEGNVSQQFKDAGQASADAASARTNKIIASLSAMRAPSLVQQQRSRDYGKAAGEVGAINSANNSVGGAFGVDMGNVQPDPFTGLAAGVMGGVGQGLAAKNANDKLLKALSGMRGNADAAASSFGGDGW